MPISSFQQEVGAFFQYLPISASFAMNYDGESDYYFIREAPARVAIQKLVAEISRISAENRKNYKFSQIE